MLLSLRYFITRFHYLLISLLLLSSHKPIAGTQSSKPKNLDFTVIQTAAHNPKFYTQGLVYSKPWLYESSGLYQKSRLIKYDSKTGFIQAERTLPPQYFAEGIELVGNTLYLLTWHAGKLLSYDALTLTPAAEFFYSGQGWGLTHDGLQFIMSDGSDKLTFRNTRTFKKTKTLAVRWESKKVKNINELEYAKGSIWANIWQTPYIITISPRNGNVSGVLNMTALVKKNGQIRGDAVLNGIAYDSQKDAFWVTGKYWPNRYLIKVLGEK